MHCKRAENMALRSWWADKQKPTGQQLNDNQRLKFKHISSKQCIDGVKHCWSNLVTVAQVAVALPAAGTGAAEARGGLRDGGLGAQRRVLVLTADEFRLWWRTLHHLPQTCCKARCHGDTAAADINWNRYRVKCRWAKREQDCTDETCGK